MHACAAARGTSTTKTRIMSDSSLTGRKFHLDILRILAIFLVLFNHTAAFHHPFSHVPNSLPEFGALVVSICDKVAVPLFFMISGALLLVREESIGQLLKKRVWRYVVVIILFQLLQHGYAHFVHGATFEYREFLRHCVMGQPCVHGNWAVWFLYAYLAYILLLPLLRIMVKHMTNLHFLYLFAVQILLCAFVPYEKTGCSSWLPFCNSVFVYILAGYYVEHRVEVKCIGKKYFFLLIAGSVCCVLLSAAMCEVDRLLAGRETIRQGVLCFKGGLLVPCITIYLLVKRWAQSLHSLRWGGLLKTLGGAVFTIMLTENILRWIAGICVFRCIGGGYAADICTVLLACTIGFPVGILLKRIPVVNRYV